MLAVLAPTMALVAMVATRVLADDGEDCSDRAGALLRSAPARVVAACSRLAGLGDPAGQNRLGVLLSDGRAMPKDDVKAFDWYRRSAEQGHAPAQFNIASAYFFGRGVPPDTTKAIEWYRKAADQGFAQAQAVLGSLYRVGLGVPRDYLQAYVWFSLAVARGDADALRVRDETGTLLTAAELAEAERRIRAWQPAAGK
jgi:TPR repeat protein